MFRVIERKCKRLADMKQGRLADGEEERKTRIMACLVAGKRHHGRAQRTLARNGPPSVAAALVF